MRGPQKYPASLGVPGRVPPKVEGSRKRAENPCPALGCRLVWAKDGPPSVASHPLAETMSVPCRCTLPTAESARLPLVLPSRPHGLRAIVEGAAARARVPLNLRHEADSFLVLKDLVVCGLGFAILPRSSIRREEAEGRMLVAPLIRPAIRRQVVLAQPPDRAPGRATQAVLDLLVEEVAARAKDGDWQTLRG